jgi:hypothetical protein
MFYSPRLTKISYLVWTLALSLPQCGLAIYIDNYFTSMPLFIELRAYNFSATRIICPHKEFLDKLTKIKT